MSKKSYSEEVRDLVIARDKLRDALLEAHKPVIIRLTWLLDRPHVLIPVVTFLGAIAVTVMIVCR